MPCVCVVRRVREVWGAHRREAVVAETVNGFPISFRPARRVPART